MAECSYCKGDFAPDDLRPYGPGGASTCFPCAMATPARQAAAEGAYGALLDGVEAVSPTGVVMIGESDGPRPFDPREAT